MKRATSYKKVTSHKSLADDGLQDSSVRRKPIFRPRPDPLQTAGSRGGSLYTEDELMGKLSSPAYFQMMERRGSQRNSPLSDTIPEELAFAEASFNPNDLLKEGLDEWHDRSRNLQRMKRSKSVSGSTPRPDGRPSPGFKPSFRFPVSSSSEARRDDGPGSYQPYVTDEGVKSRHRYDSSASGNSGHFAANYEDHGSQAWPAKIPREYANLIHLGVLYHQALLKHGFKDEAHQIAIHLSQLQAADLEDMMALELGGIDLLLRDGLLKYLMSIQPYIPSIPSQVVKFKDVGFSATVQLDTGYESILTKVLDTIKGPFMRSPLEKVTLLRDVTGYFMPGTLTLIMGTPFSGTSVINSVLSGRSRGLAGSTRTEGSITYNGRSVDDIKSRRFVSVLGPDDVHFDGLSVRETLEFARECSQYYKTEHYGDELKAILGDVLKSGQDPKLETNLSTMGLKRVADLRPTGIPCMSEAERRRLSVAEMIAGTHAVYMFDLLNKGLDSTATFDLVTSLRICARVQSTTVVATLIQPAQDVFDLFDRIILLDRSQIVYQGPRQDALPYFQSFGYFKPRELSVPEFLEGVTTTEGAQQYLQVGYPRLSVEGFVAAYKNSDLYKDVCRIVDNPEVVQDIWVQGSQPLGVTFEQSRRNSGQGIVGTVTTVVSSLDEKGGSLVDISMNNTLTVHPGDEVVAVGGPWGSGMLNYVKVRDTSKDFQGASELLDQPETPVRLQLERPFPDDGSYDLQFSRDYVQDPWPEFLLLLGRDLKASWRYKLGLIIRAVQMELTSNLAMVLMFVYQPVAKFIDLMYTNWGYVWQVLVLGFYVSIVFFRVHTQAEQLNMNLLRSVFFTSLLDMTIFNLGQLPDLVQERQIYYKQNGANFYRPSSYLFAKLVGNLPIAFVEATSWTTIVYFLTNLSVKDGGWHFWVFYIVIVLTVLNGAAMVRFLAAFAPDATAANRTIGYILAILNIFAGFLIPHFKIPKYWVWAYWINPLQWGTTALMINEFSSTSYDALCKDVNVTLLPQCRGLDVDNIGHAYLLGGQFHTGKKWIGIAIAVLFGWFIVWTLLTFHALSSIRHIPREIITPSAEAKFLRKTESLIERDLERQGAALSVFAAKVTLSWHEISYDVLIPGLFRTLPLLTYVSGWAEPGEMVGLVGASGAGKTILLNCLAGRRINPQRIRGQILVNGYPKVQNAFVRVMGYADRLEAYSPYMTVLEAIGYSSELQLGKTTIPEERRRFVQEILELLELKKVANTLVKSLGQSSLTLPESTRLRVATELARNPSVLFIDEPTKSNDSRSALHTVKILKKIADSGRIVIVAVALPSQRLLTCFTSVQILKRGGETVYWGPVGRDGELLRAYFEAIPETPLCPPNTSVATYAVDVVGDGVQDHRALKDYVFEYRVSELASHNQIQLQRLRRAKGTLGLEISDTSFGSRYATRARNTFTKLQTNYWRNVAYSWGRLFSTVATALFLGSIYFQQKSNTTDGMNIKAGAIFISALLLAPPNATGVIPQVVGHRATFDREKSVRQYNHFLLSLSWTFGEVPYVIVSTLIYAIIFCWMVNLAFNSPAVFFLYWFVLFELTLGFTFFGMFLTSVTVLPQIAGTAVTIFIGFWGATSGYVVPKQKILPEFEWIFWTNPFQHALSTMTSISFFCDVDSSECLDEGRNPGCLTNPLLCPQCRCERLTDTQQFTWSTIKFNRTLDHSRIPYEVFVLFCFVLLFRLATLAVWKYRGNIG